MVKKIMKYAKFMVCIILMISLIAPSYAALSASDGSAFVTKAEFDSALADFNARLTTFEAGINSKIDSQVTSYLDRNGIWNGQEQTLSDLWYVTEPLPESQAAYAKYHDITKSEALLSGMFQLFSKYSELKGATLSGKTFWFNGKASGAVDRSNKATWEKWCLANFKGQMAENKITEKLVVENVNKSGMLIWDFAVVNGAYNGAENDVRGQVQYACVNNSTSTAAKTWMTQAYDVDYVWDESSSLGQSYYGRPNLSYYESKGFTYKIALRSTPDDVSNLAEVTVATPNVSAVNVKNNKGWNWCHNRNIYLQSIIDGGGTLPDGVSLLDENQWLFAPALDLTGGNFRFQCFVSKGQKLYMNELFSFNINGAAIVNYQQYLTGEDPEEVGDSFKYYNFWFYNNIVTEAVVKNISCKVY